MAMATADVMSACESTTAALFGQSELWQLVLFWTGRIRLWYTMRMGRARGFLVTIWAQLKDHFLFLCFLYRFLLVSCHSQVCLYLSLTETIYAKLPRYSYTECKPPPIVISQTNTIHTCRSRFFSNVSSSKLIGNRTLLVVILGWSIILPKEI